MNFFSVLRASGWTVRRLLLALLSLITMMVISSPSDAASLRIGLVHEAPPFVQAASTDGILADQLSILLADRYTTQLQAFADMTAATQALEQQRIDLLVTATPPAGHEIRSAPMLVFPLSILRLKASRQGARLRFPAIPAADAPGTLTGSATINENVLRMVRGEATQLIAPRFLLEQYMLRTPVTTLDVQAVTPLTALHYHAWALPSQGALIAEINQLISMLNYQDAHWLEQKWLLPPGSVFSMRYPPTDEITTPLAVHVLLPPAPAPWVRVANDGTISGVWRSLFSSLLTPDRFSLIFSLQNHDNNLIKDPAAVTIRIVAGQQAPNPAAQRYDVLHWGILSLSNALLSSKPAALRHERLAILRDSPLLTLMNDRFSQASLVQVDDLAQGIALLHAGGVKGVIGETFSLSEALTQQKETTLRLAPLDLPETPVWFEIAGPQNLAVQQVRQVLATVTEWDIQNSRMQNQQQPADLTLSRSTLWLIVMGIVSLFAILLALIVWSAAQLQRRQREQEKSALHNALSLWQTLVNNAPVPLFVCDPAGRLTRYNATFSNAPFLPASLHEGMLASELPLHEMAARLTLPDRLNLLNSATPLSGETTLDDGKTTLLWWLCRYTDNLGRPVGIVGGWVNISEKAALTQALNHALAQAKQASEEKSIFLARMSHEIRTPLNAVLGLLEMERDKNQLLETAWQAALTLRDLIGDILDLSRIEAGELQLHTAPHSLLQSLQANEAIFASSARSKGLHWHCELHLPEQRYHLFDKVRLNQIVVNLLGNAIKYTSHGEIRFYASYQDEQLSLAIIDTGVGIPPQSMAMLGQAWFQVDSHAPQSSGLGLAICHQLVALMAGTINITSVTGQGTEVRVKLPLPQAEAPSYVEPPVATLPRQQVLIVDDFPPNLTVMRLQLEKMGQHVICCSTAAEALDVLARHTVDVLITDCQMPQMDGYQLVRTVLLRNMLGQAHAPSLILGCTANALPVEEERARHAGMDDLLRKPLSADRLQQTLAKFASANQALPDLTALHALAGHQPDIIVTMCQQMIDAVDDDLARLKAPPASVETLSRIAHRLKASWSLLGMSQALRCCLVVEALPELIAAGTLNDTAIDTLVTQFIAVMAVSLEQLKALKENHPPA